MTAGSAHLVLFLILPCTAFAEEAQGVVVGGLVTYTGPLPKAIPIPEALSERRPVERDEKSRGLKDVVVWVEGIRTKGGPPQKKSVSMDQKEFMFVPHVLAIEAGQTVEFLNSDSANHGVQTSSSEQSNRFNIVTPAGQGYKHRFRSCPDPVRIGCPLHASMAAWIFVFDHPCFAVTDSEGKFRLPPLPPGKYRLRVHHPSGGMRRTTDLVVEADKPQSLRIEFTGKDLKVNP